jgi:hypothetical protein
VSSALIALVSDGLYINHGKVLDVLQPPVLKLAFERRQALFGLALLAMALITVFCAGVGYGLRHPL